MYLSTISIRNIKGIEKLDLDFESKPGWHILLGDNGSGKSTIIKAISLGIIRSQEILGIKPNWNSWLKYGKNDGKISTIFSGKDLDLATENIILFKRSNNKTSVSESNLDIPLYLEESFTAGFGPFRRFSGSTNEMDELFKNPSFSNLAAHLTLFDESIALSQVTKWLQTLQFKSLEKSINKGIVENLMALINSEGFLPHGSKLLEITSDDVIFKDGSGAKISISQLSDGFRSILSLALELLRLMVGRFGEEVVFGKLSKTNNYIHVMGIVLIDEIDAHLHPEWQAKIGDWFQKYFPNIQFIVTTHSPIVCRAAGNSKIYRLPTPGKGEKVQEIKGIEKDKLVLGNILDAYGTEAFGKLAVKSGKTDESLEKLGRLNMLSALGKISETEKKERIHLQRVLKTSDPVTP